MTIENELQERQLRRLKAVPWVLELQAGTLDDPSQITYEQFLIGLIGLLAGANEDMLFLAREIDRLKTGHDDASC